MGVCRVSSRQCGPKGVQCGNTWTVTTDRSEPRPSLSWTARARRAIVGPPEIRSLTITHALDDIADGFLNIALLGSLFFSVSLEASRDRILLYLVLTVAPLAVIAPLVAPLLERTRAGFRATMVTTELLRAIAALALVSSLKSPAFYPLVFVVLLSRKVYALARTAILPNLVPTPDRLADASGYLSRAGTIAGGLGTLIGGAVLGLVNAELVPLIAVPVFLVAAFTAHRIPTASLSAQPGSRYVQVEVPAEVRRAGLAVCGMRASNGALAYLLAFAIKRGGVNTWVFVVALAAAGIGSFIGTLITGSLHRRLVPSQVVSLVLLVPGAVTALSVISAGNFGIVVVALSIGLGSSVATRTMDAMYGQVPDVARGRAISANELRFQLSNVTGAVLAVMLTPSPRLGIFVVAIVLLVSGATFASRGPLSWRRGAGALLLGASNYSQTLHLPRALFDEARVQAQQGGRRLSIVTSHAAVRSALAQRAIEPPDGWAELALQGDAVLSGTPVTVALVDRMLAAAQQAVERFEAASDDATSRQE